MLIRASSELGKHHSHQSVPSLCSAARPHRRFDRQGAVADTILGDAAVESRCGLKRITPIDTLRDAEPKLDAVSGGNPLSLSERRFFEPRFGCDFSRVRVHDDAQADSAAQSVGALAYTRGQDIVFRTDKYKPAIASGRRLIAHELAHVVQQGAGLKRGIDEHSTSRKCIVQRAVDEDGGETGENPVVQTASTITSEEAARRGREALETIGYHALIRRAVGAGLLAPEGASRNQTHVQRHAAADLVQRQDFATVFTPYAVAAGIASQVDSPAPGPGDIVALGILAVGLVAAAVAVSQARPCPPCPAPPSPDVDRVPPSRPHFPCPGDHWHYYEYNQNPATCQCFGPRRLFGGCCLGLPGQPC